MSLSVISTPARPPQVLIHWVHSVQRSGDRIHSHIGLWPATCDLRIRPKKKSWYRIFPDLPAAQPSKPFVYSFKEISVLKMLHSRQSLAWDQAPHWVKKGGKIGERIEPRVNLFCLFPHLGAWSQGTKALTDMIINCGKSVPCWTLLLRQTCLTVSTSFYMHKLMSL